MGEGESMEGSEQQQSPQGDPRPSDNSRRRRHNWGHRMEQRVWSDIEKGIEQDVSQMKRDDMSSEDYWRKVWTDIHKDGYKGPEVINNPDLKEKWEKMKSEGTPLEEVWSDNHSEEAVNFVWIPMMKRWRNIGATENGKGFRKHMFEAFEKHHLETLTPELKKEYELMKSENKQAEFWQKNISELGHLDGEGRGPWIMMENGEHPHHWHRGYYGYGGHRGPLAWIRRRKAQFEDEAIYKEFDFC